MRQTSRLAPSSAPASCCRAPSSPLTHSPQVPQGSGPWGGLSSPAAGNYYVSVQGSGSYVEQTVTGLVDGSAYDLTFWTAERPGYSNSESMRVLVDGVPVLDSSQPPCSWRRAPAP